ncbi:MAG: hypothetical protein GX683_00100, partial [Ruminococcaceae bacterium]|nr:hypothetical protein [Oscillospiraceae bacterium]
MACFIVPTAEAIIVTAATQLVKSKEKTPAKVTLNCTNGGIETAERLPFSRKLKWLSNLLWGGSALLAFEHVWHGEITAWFPFLTAAGNTK